MNSKERISFSALKLLPEIVRKFKAMLGAIHNQNEQLTEKEKVEKELEKISSTRSNNDPDLS